MARRLGVSHQAPYKHFPSRDAILAEMLTRAYREFTEFLSQRPHTEDPYADLRLMGERYLTYAMVHPLKYRLMFSGPLPDAAIHPLMMGEARGAFALLVERIGTMALSRLDSGVHPERDAMFIWSCLHGLASIAQSDITKTLGISGEELGSQIEHSFQRLARAVEPDQL